MVSNWPGGPQGDHGYSVNAAQKEKKKKEVMSSRGSHPISFLVAGCFVGRSE